MKRIVRIERQDKRRDGRASTPEEIDSTVALIQALIPLGLHAVGEALEAEVVALAGARYRRSGGRPGVVRWGQQPGSVYLADQKLPIPVPRVRDRVANREIPLTTYERLQVPRAADAGLFRKVLVGLTCRQYAACAEAVPAAFGLSASSVSRRFIRASARHLQILCERRLDGDEFVAVVLDGKTFAQDALVIALGITVQGQKKIRGFVQTATENEAVCAAFLRALVARGLRVAPGLLCVIDGAKGLRTAIQTVFGSQALVQRCQWHKRENVVRDLPKAQQASWRRRLQQAYERSTYTEARTALGRLRQELRTHNLSAAHSLDEGLEETLTLHRLGVFPVLGVSLKTTNCLESLNAQLGQLTDKVDHWRTSDQKHRWVASALLLIEPRLRRIKGYRHLSQLQMALRTEIPRESVTDTRIA
ncbi:MAG TPA: transposase [Candidatus Acidoferrum sp.]|nr:transposase [Candidatus Methylomirabilis sp.]HWU40122.1 transposase [Candidatus Acidoferrum sp.]